MGGEHMLSTKTSVKSELPFDTRKPVARANGALRGHAGEPLQLFSTCPQSFGFDKESYARQVRKVARWSERCGCQGILVDRKSTRLNSSHGYISYAVFCLK